MTQSEVHVWSGLPVIFPAFMGLRFARRGSNLCNRSERRGEPAHLLGTPAPFPDRAPPEAVAEGERATLVALAAVRAVNGRPRAHAGVGFRGRPLLPRG